MQKINETLAKHAESLVKHADALVALTGWYGKLVEAQVRLTEVQQEHATSIAELVEAGKRTDERLDALILTVEKYISSRNGGRAGKRRGRRREN
jgi:predicted Rossmann-fold nucleotide-binding protein